MLWTLRHRSVMCYYYCYYYCCPSSARTIPALALHLKHVPLCGDGRQRIKPSKRPSYTFRRMEFKSRDLCTWYRVLLSGLDGWAWRSSAARVLVFPVGFTRTSFFLVAFCLFDFIPAILFHVFSMVLPYRKHPRSIAFLPRIGNWV